MNNLQQLLINNCPVDLYADNTDSVYYKNTIKQKFSNKSFYQQVKVMEEAIKDTILKTTELSVVEDKPTAIFTLQNNLQELGIMLNEAMLMNGCLHSYLPYKLITKAYNENTEQIELVEEFRNRRDLYSYLRLFYFITHYYTKFHVERLGGDLLVIYSTP